MRLQNALMRLMGGVQQAHPRQLGNNTPQAHRYAQNPQAREFMSVDPSQFGYGPDNAIAGMAQPAQGMASLGANVGGYDLQSNPDQAPVQPTYLPQMQQQIQGGMHNRGVTPLQGSRMVRPIQARYSNWFDY